VGDDPPPRGSTENGSPAPHPHPAPGRESLPAKTGDKRPARLRVVEPGAGSRKNLLEPPADPDLSRWLGSRSAPRPRDLRSGPGAGWDFAAVCAKGCPCEDPAGGAGPQGGPR